MLLRTGWLCAARCWPPGENAYSRRTACIQSLCGKEKTSMAPVLSPSVQRIMLHNVPWATYESLLVAHRDCRVSRFTYDRGQLEIMSPSAVHEELKDTMTLFVNTAAEEMAINTCT